jgi:hypothetical protein
MEQHSKIKVKEFGPYLSELITSGDTLDEIMVTLAEHKNLGYEGVCIVDSYSGDYRLFTHREETDNEYNRRLKGLEILRKKEEKKKENRRKQFEKLQAEFGVEGVATGGKP